MTPDKPTDRIDTDHDDFSAVGIEELQVRATYEYLGLRLNLNGEMLRKKLEPLAYNRRFKDYLYEKLQCEETLIPAQVALVQLYFIETRATQISATGPSNHVGLYFHSGADGPFTPNPKQQGNILAKFWKDFFDKRDQGVIANTLDLKKLEKEQEKVVGTVYRGRNRRTNKRDE